MEVNKGDFCLLKGMTSDFCVRVIEQIDDYHGAKRFVGEKIGVLGVVVVRRAFFQDDVLKVITKGGKLPLYPTRSSRQV